ncbi:MAG: extracellular solute-binding protein [Pleomorphochaeta sp.]
MATIKDIAQLAGVSHGTVSNVLNKRGNVSFEKIQLVQNAMNELGYKVNTQAQKLRKGKSNQIALIIPRLEISRYVDIYQGLQTSLIDYDYEVTIYCSNDSAVTEMKLVNELIATNPTAILVVSVLSKFEYNIDSDIPIFFLMRTMNHPLENSVGIYYDYYKVGCDVAKKCIKDGKKNIACFAGAKSNTNDSKFYKGCSDTFDENDINYKIFATENTISYQAAFSIINDLSNFDSIIAIGRERCESLYSALKIKSPIDYPKIYGVVRKSNIKIDYIEKYELNYKYIGIIAGNQIIADKFENKLLKADGFTSDIKTNNSYEHDQINFLALKSPTSEAISYLIPKFTRATGIKVKIIQVGYDELYKKALSAENSKAYDIIRTDMAWLTQFGDKIYKELDPESNLFKYIRNSLNPYIPECFYKTKGINYSFPFDISTQMLYYKKDIFNDVSIKRAYFEKTKKHLEVPKTFEDYDFIAKFFTRKFNLTSPTKYGTTPIAGFSVSLSCELLPRLKAENIDIFDKNGKINVNTPEIREEVKKYLSLSEYSSNLTHKWWDNAIEEFAHGDVAMTIVFSNHASRISQTQNVEILNNVGFSSIPGSHPLLGGGVIGVAKKSEKDREVEIFLKWLFSDEITTLINYLGGYICSTNTQENVDTINLYPWTINGEQYFKNGWRDCSKNNKKFVEYEFELVLGEALSSIKSGLLSIDEGLEEAQNNLDKLYNN